MIILALSSQEPTSRPPCNICLCSGEQLWARFLVLSNYVGLGTRIYMCTGIMMRTPNSQVVEYFQLISTNRASTSTWRTVTALQNLFLFCPGPEQGSEATLFHLVLIMSFAGESWFANESTETQRSKINCSQAHTESDTALGTSRTIDAGF